MNAQSTQSNRRRGLRPHLVPLIHPSWRPDAANDRASAEKLKPEEFWQRLGL